MPLTPKQQRFVEEYLIDLNATQAAIRAGYSERTAKQQGQRLLTYDDVQAAVSQAQEGRSERTRITQDYVLETIRDTIERARKDKNHNAVLKGSELLGRHLKMFPTKVDLGSDPENPPKLIVEIVDPTRPADS